LEPTFENRWSKVPNIALPEPGHDTVSSGNLSVCKNRKHGVDPLARRSQPDQPGRLCNRAGLNTVPLQPETFITLPINNYTSHVDWYDSRRRVQCYQHSDCLFIRMYYAAISVVRASKMNHESRRKLPWPIFNVACCFCIRLGEYRSYKNDSK
jgi:hypothetical protein